MTTAYAGVSNEAAMNAFSKSFTHGVKDAILVVGLTAIEYMSRMAMEQVGNSQPVIVYVGLEAATDLLKWEYLEQARRPSA